MSQVPPLNEISLIPSQDINTTTNGVNIGLNPIFQNIYDRLKLLADKFNPLLPYDPLVITDRGIQTDNIVNKAVQSWHYVPQRRRTLFNTGGQLSANPLVIGTITLTPLFAPYQVILRGKVMWEPTVPNESSLGTVAIQRSVNGGISWNTLEESFQNVHMKNAYPWTTMYISAIDDNISTFIGPVQYRITMRVDRVGINVPVGNTGNLLLAGQSHWLEYDITNPPIA